MPVTSRLSRAIPTILFKNAYQFWRSHAFTDTITTLLTSNNSVILSERSESKDPRLSFAHSTTNPEWETTNLNYISIFFKNLFFEKGT
jgi:hypothetical protein